MDDELGDIQLVKIEKRKYWLHDDWYLKYITLKTPYGDYIEFPCYRWITGEGELVLRDGRGEQIGPARPALPRNAGPGTPFLQGRCRGILAMWPLAGGCCAAPRSPAGGVLSPGTENSRLGGWSEGPGRASHVLPLSYSPSREGCDPFLSEGN